MKTIILGMFMLLFLISSCDDKNNSFAEASGKIEDILVVADKGVWDSHLKECIDSNLTQYIMPFFPDVATFQLIHKTPTHFEQGVKKYRNILFLKIDPKFKGTKGKIVQHKDVWAKGQVVIEITAQNFDMLEETCKIGLDEVHSIFDKATWRRLIDYFDTYDNTALRNKIKKQFGIDIVLPGRSTLVTNKSNFYRIEFPSGSRPIEFQGNSTSQDAGLILSGMMIYQYDYVDSSQFEFATLLRDRDTILKYFVPHEIKGLYMGTQYESIIYPEGNVEYSADGKVKGYDIRGMFKFTGRPIYSTGGAFWEFHFKHPKRDKMICLSGYLDAPPTTSWTHPLREIQAVLRSLKIE